jgi:hypothetical protein
MTTIAIDQIGPIATVKYAAWLHCRIIVVKKVHCQAACNVDYPTNHMYAPIGKERIKKSSLAQAIFFFVRLHATKKKYPNIASNYNQDLGIITDSNHVPLINRAFVKLRNEI